MQKKLKVGELVQIWDSSPDSQGDVSLPGHGEFGYLVKKYDASIKVTPDDSITSQGCLWKVICFGNDPPDTYEIHESWLNLVRESSDIQKVE